MDIPLDCLDLRYADLRVDDAARLGRLVQSMRRLGQQSPVLVVPGEADAFVLIDGYGRFAAMRELGADAIEAVVLEVPEAEALILAHRLESRRRRSALEEAWLIVVLLDRHGLKRGEVARRLGRSVSWVSRRVALVRELPATVQQSVRRGFVPAHAAGTFLVPLTRVNKDHCAQLVANLGRRSVTSRQVERLYMGYRRAEDEGRERIVAQPWLFLAADAAAQPEPVVPAGDPAAPLIDDLEAICGISRRARRRIREGLLAELDATRRHKVTRQAVESRLVSQTLFDILLLQEERECSTGTPGRPS